ncbi:unnamed protein product [Toxocara canis]|uniref:Doublecortin domain-containing protein n=1 Tax=Toxocara canis TaxID=6265 RepID=A0A183UAD3_TOXCA|nr:unnamed protein product [Toxocara canis]
MFIRTSLLLARSAYDPYNNISYLQINKSRRGERERSENEKIYNRPPPTVKKIFLKPNGDARFRPRLFMWRVWRIPRLNGLIQEAGEFLGFEKGVAEKLYALDGDLIEDEEEIIDGNTYIVAGNEPFDLRITDIKCIPLCQRLGRIKKMQSTRHKYQSHLQCSEMVRVAVNSYKRLIQRPFTAGNGNRHNTQTGEKDNRESDNEASSSANNAYSVVMEPGAATDWRSEFGEIPPKPHEAINTAFSYADQLEEFDEDTVVGSARSYVEKHREQRNDVKSRPVTLRSEAEELPRLSGVTNATHNLENGFIEKGEKNVRERKRYAV